jgi:hypothetical protein
MNYTILEIFFRGLIAFVHDRPEPDLMTAYLVADRHHLPLLAFEMKAASICPDTKFGDTFCFKDTRKSNWCFCYLGDPVDLSFDPEPQKGKPSLGSRPIREVPGNEAEAEDFEWLVRMSNVDRNAAQAKPDANLGGTVAAKLSFGWESAQTCHLDQKEDERNHRFKVYPFKFVSDFTQPTGTFIHEQALSEYARFNLKFHSTPSVKLVIKKRGGTENIVVDLGCSDGKCPSLLIANEPFPGHDEQEYLQGFGMHFKKYYQLSLNSTDEKKIPIRLRRDTFTVPNSPKNESVDCIEVGNDQLYTCGCDPLRKRAALILNNPDTFPTLDRVDAERPELAHPTRLLLKRLDKLIITAVDTRIICPMAMFEP